VDPADFAEQQKKGVGQGAKKLEVPRDICDVCNLFGHPIFASRLRFADMKVKAGTWHELLLQVRDGVAIDRETGTVAGPMKFDFEVVPPGVQFELAVTADNVEDWQLAMLFAAVEAMNDGVGRLGGSTSRGLGAVELKFDKYLDMTAPELLTGKKEPKTDLDELRRRCAGQLSEVLGNGGQQ
jgi:CRISPR/Cas system CSM-associated protein Csm3 (group 7 of RAMP superfamily)